MSFLLVLFIFFSLIFEKSKTQLPKIPQIPQKLIFWPKHYQNLTAFKINIIFNQLFKKTSFNMDVPPHKIWTHQRDLLNI